MSPPSRDDYMIVVVTCPKCGTKSRHIVTENARMWGKKVKL